MITTKNINNQSSINNFGNDVSINCNLIILDDAGNSTTIIPASGILPAITTLSALTGGHFIQTFNYLIQVIFILVI